MRSAFRAVFTAGLVLCALQSQAAIMNLDYTLNVPIDGGWVGGAGTLGPNGSDDWLLEVAPDGQDAQVTSIALEFSQSQGSLELFNREEVSTDVNGWVSLGGPVLTSGGGIVQVAALTFMALDAFDYALRVTGAAGLVGAPYVLGVAAVSPVPLPAAAWLFISVFLGGAWLSRRRGGSVRTGEKPARALA